MTSETVTRHNGTTLRYYRIKEGLKVAELASLAKCQYSHLDNLENERKEASLELLQRLATVLKVPVAALVRHPSYALHASDRGAA